MILPHITCPQVQLTILFFIKILLDYEGETHFFFLKRSSPTFVWLWDKMKYKPRPNESKNRGKKRSQSYILFKSKRNKEIQFLLLGCCVRHEYDIDDFSGRYYLHVQSKSCSPYKECIARILQRQRC